MKRYYSITILAIIVITLLQGYNISLQYKDYLHYKIEKINSILKLPSMRNMQFEHIRTSTHIMMGNSEFTIKK